MGKNKNTFSLPPSYTSPTEQRNNKSNSERRRSDRDSDSDSKRKRDYQSLPRRRDHSEKYYSPPKRKDDYKQRDSDSKRKHDDPKHSGKPHKEGDHNYKSLPKSTSSKIDQKYQSLPRKSKDTELKLQRIKDDVENVELSDEKSNKNKEID